MEFTIYSKPNCSQCEQAKKLLSYKGMQYSELIIDVGQEKDPNKTYVTVAELKQKVPNAVSVPQIFKQDTYVGGFTQLKQMIGI